MGRPIGEINGVILLGFSSFPIVLAKVLLSLLITTSDYEGHFGM